MPTITIATLWLTDHDGKVLLLRKPSEAVFSELGGTLEAGETPEQTLVRKCREDAGLDLEAVAQQTNAKAFAGMNLEMLEYTLQDAALAVTPSGEYSGGEAVWESGSEACPGHEWAESGKRGPRPPIGCQWLSQSQGGQERKVGTVSPLQGETLVQP